MIHQPKAPQLNKGASSSQRQDESSPQQSHKSDTQWRSPSSHDDISSHLNSVVLLAIARALLITQQGYAYPVRMLNDSGSELSFIFESLIHLLNIQMQRCTISIIGIGAAQSGNARRMATVILKFIHFSNSIIFNAHILSKLSSTIPSTTLPFHYRQHI